MEIAAQLKKGISRQFSTGSLKLSGKLSFKRQSSMDPRQAAFRFSFGRQSSMDPIRRSPAHEELTVPENLDSTMQLLFMACRGDVNAVVDLLNEGIDVNSIDLDGRTALHIAACEGHVEVVKVLLSRKANIDARDRWGSTAASDAKYYGNHEIFNILKARGARAPKTRKTPMVVLNPREVPEYEINPMELQFRRGEVVVAKGTYQVAKWNGTKVSVKILDKDGYSDPESIDAFKHELTLLEKIRHPNVIQFVGAVTQNMPMMIVVEYHPKGDLATYLQKKGRLQPSKALRFALDIARGMNCLHECKPDPVIHCDLNTKNVLLDRGGLLKVAGFGLISLSKLSDDKVKLTRPWPKVDCSRYVAPEVYKDEIFDRSVDIFSFSFILYEMMEGTPPFHMKSPEDAAKLSCLEGSRPPFKVKSKNYPPDLKELIEECWSSEPSERPRFPEIIGRLDKIVAHCSKQGWWKDTFKLPWK